MTLAKDSVVWFLHFVNHLPSTLLNRYSPKDDQGQSPRGISNGKNWKGRENILPIIKTKYTNFSIVFNLILKILK